MERSPPATDGVIELRPHWRRVRIDSDEDKAHYARSDGKTWVRWWSGTTIDDEAADLDDADAGAECRVKATMREEVEAFKAGQVVAGHPAQVVEVINLGPAAHAAFKRAMAADDRFRGAYRWLPDAEGYGYRCEACNGVSPTPTDGRCPDGGIVKVYPPGPAPDRELLALVGIDLGASGWCDGEPWGEE